MSRSSHAPTSDTSDINYGSDNNWDQESAWDSDTITEDKDNDIPKKDDITSSNSNPCLSLNITDSLKVHLSMNSNSTGKTSKEVGEASNTAKKLECLFNSGCEISTSSAEFLTPEFLQSLQLERSDRKKETTFRAKSEPENIKVAKTTLKKPGLNTAVVHLSGRKSDCNFKQNRGNFKIFLFYFIYLYPTKFSSL